MRIALSVLIAFILPPMVLAQGDAASRFFDDRLAEYAEYMKAREQLARTDAEKRAVARERAECKRRIESARMGYTGLSPEEHAFWDNIKTELNSVLKLWQQTADADEEEKKSIHQSAIAAVQAAQRSYEAQMRFAMAQLGVAACMLDSETVAECAAHFRAELQREYRQDFQSLIFAAPWGLEDEPEEEEKAEPSHEAGEAEEGTVDLNAGDEDNTLDAPATPLMVHELAHENTHNDAARAESASRAAALWQGYLRLCSQQVEVCFGSERGAALVCGTPLPGAVELSHFQAVQERSKLLFQAAEQAWAAYVDAVVAAYDPGWQASEGAIAHSPVSADAVMLRFPLYATHEQYLAFVLSPHLLYTEPEPLPDTSAVED